MMIEANVRTRRDRPVPATTERRIQMQAIYGLCAIAAVYWALPRWWFILVAVILFVGLYLIVKMNAHIQEMEDYQKLLLADREKLLERLHEEKSRFLKFQGRFMEISTGDYPFNALDCWDSVVASTRSVGPITPEEWARIIDEVEENYSDDPVGWSDQVLENYIRWCSVTFERPPHGNERSRKILKKVMAILHGGGYHLTVFSGEKCQAKDVTIEQLLEWLQENSQTRHAVSVHKPGGEFLDVIVLGRGEAK